MANHNWHSQGLFSFNYVIKVNANHICNRPAWGFVVTSCPEKALNLNYSRPYKHIPQVIVKIYLFYANWRFACMSVCTRESEPLELELRKL